MPFVPHIRKQIARALDEFILPALRNDEVVQVLADAPYSFPHVPFDGIEAPLLENGPSLLLQPSWYWKQERMSAGRSPYLIIIFQGTYQHNIGVTPQMVERARAQGNELRFGRLQLSLSAPSCLYIPPATPGQDGTHIFHQGYDPAKILCFNLWNQEILAHVAESGNMGVECSHSVSFKDASLVQMAKLYSEELRACTDAFNASAQAQLYVFCSRIRRLLTTTIPPLMNTSWNEGGVSDYSSKGRLCLLAMQYVECHLNDPLTREMLARNLGVSASYLNQTFRDIEGVSLMRYVTQRRIEAAKRILENTDESLKDVSQLTGFASPASFCGVFKRMTGVTPKQYRRENHSRRRERRERCPV